jgi:hypothetical protein
MSIVDEALNMLAAVTQTNLPDEYSDRGQEQENRDRYIAEDDDRWSDERSKRTVMTSDRQDVSYLDDVVGELK